MHGYEGAGTGMNNRPLGRTGIGVSELSFGTVSLGIPYGIGVKGAEGMIPESDAVALLRLALERGVNFYDTARAYGCSEDRIGKAFAGKRSEVVLCTKCPHLHGEDGKLLPARQLKKAIDDSLHASLSALRTDFVDVFMSHSGTVDVLGSETVQETFAGYKKNGLARAIGVSTYTVQESQMAIESGIWDMIQLPYNLMDQRQGAVFGVAGEKGVGIVVRSVLFKGILTERGKNLHPMLRAVEQHRERYSELLNEHARSLSELATKFVLSQPNVSSVLVGLDKAEYLEQALSVADGDYLDEETLARARQLEYPDVSFLDLRKWDRMGWLT
jgi:1-deoxyxylulose-5-phosphate synthase